MKRTIIRIDEEKCNGCGECIIACHEGALQIIDGKARLISEIYCDGLGDCLGECPTGAITFGDIADETTEVYKVKQSDRNYSLLGYLNIRPRTTYLSKLRNPNAKMPDYYKMPLTRAEYKAKGKAPAAH